jgi:ADP-dependent NAD(P)H-hydrate dehydratase / NAD(P)H-hydrate epimerase
MKILPVDKIREADAYTIRHEPVADIDLMERAASACYYYLAEHLHHDKRVLVVAGTGNNGGDGFAIARMLRAKEFQVEVFLAGDAEKLSPSCRVNFERWISGHGHGSAGNEILTEFPGSGTADVVIDALFGSGMTRPVEGASAELIRKINTSNAYVISIDVPSGLLCDESVTVVKDPTVIHADLTLTFSPPKLALMFPENDRFTGNWILLDIGIMQEYIDSAETKNFFAEARDLGGVLKRRNKFAHKGHFGHALLICGGKGKMGAAILAARGCLRAGAGLTTVHVPGSGVPIIQTAVPEAMVTIDPDENVFSKPPDSGGFTSLAIGPGIGTSEPTQKALKLFIQGAGLPIILDADAINILGENKTWLSFIPKGSIFTPHPKEFERLAGKSDNDFDRNRKQREFSFKYDCYVVLKGAHTAITSPDGKCWFNSTGNPGMATGGSGDVLTGIIAGLKAQGYTSLESCLLGVYLHGAAGDLAAATMGQEALIAGDIINHLGKSFQHLYGEF